MVISLFSSHDHEFINTIANRIIELTPKGTIDKLSTYDDYIYDEQLKRATCFDVSLINDLT